MSWGLFVNHENQRVSTFICSILVGAFKEGFRKVLRVSVVTSQFTQKKRFWWQPKFFIPIDHSPFLQKCGICGMRDGGGCGHHPVFVPRSPQAGRRERGCPGLTPSSFASLPYCWPPSESLLPLKFRPNQDPFFAVAPGLCASPYYLREHSQKVVPLT